VRVAGYLHGMLLCSNSGALERLSGISVTSAVSRLCNGYHDYCCVKGGEVKCVDGHSVV
jgi:hypothetical protein